MIAHNHCFGASHQLRAMRDREAGRRSAKTRTASDDAALTARVMIRWDGARALAV
jgi:hypothetical protein